MPDRWTADRQGDPVGRVFLGSVVSNGGDRAIMEAQIAVFDAAFGPGSTATRDGAPGTVSRLLPDITALPLIHQTRMRGPARRALARTRDRRLRANGVVGRLLRTHPEQEIVQKLGEAGVVAYSGGTSLIEKYPLASKFDEIDLALDLHRPVVLMPQSLGPFTSEDTQVRMRRICERADAIFLRDERSLRFLRDIGARLDVVEVVPDIVFWLLDDSALERMRAATTPRSPRVAMSMRDCTNFFPADTAREDQRQLERAYAVLIEHIIRDRGGRVTLISTCQGVPGYWLDDSEVAERVWNTLPSDVARDVALDREFHTTADLQAVFGRHDLAVATRLHGAILALTAGTPVLPIAYEFKTHEVFGQLRASQDVLDINDATPESMAAKFDGFAARIDDARADLATRLAEVKQELQRVPARLAEVLERSSHP